MNARRFILATVASLCSIAAGALLGAPVALAESCPNAAARQGPSLNLPDCRAYEQVTPVNKGDAIDLFGSNGYLPLGADQAYAAEDGNAILMTATSSIGPVAPTTRASYVFSRGIDGWNTSVVSPPINQPQAANVEVYNPVSLAEVGFQDYIGTQGALLTGNEAGFKSENLAGQVGGSYATLTSTSGFAALATSTEVHMVGGSEDLSHVFLESEDHELAPGASAQDEGSLALYESIGGAACESSTSSCKLVDIEPDGSPFQCGGSIGQGGGQSVLGDAYSAVSRDGSRVFFTAPDPGTLGSPPVGPGCWNSHATPAEENPPQLYMRENGTSTVEISAPEEGVTVGTLANPLLPAVFVGASADGSKVFFLTRMDLTRGDTTHAGELYEYNDAPGPGEKKLTLISGGESGTIEGNVDFVGAVSSDGSEVYFSAEGQLAPGAPVPSGGSVDLYRYDTLTGKTYFVVELGADDFPLPMKGADVSGVWFRNEFGESQGISYEKEWYTTANGRDLVFGTIRPLTGYDNNKAPGAPNCISNYPGGAEPNECLELFRYDVKAEENREKAIVCVSCAGGAPVDGAYFTRSTYGALASGPPRPISENGEYVFFDSANGLVPQATSGRVHVYEWHDGNLSLISSPNDPSSAFFLGSSADVNAEGETAEGGNVFFTTHAQLVPQDTDQSADIYDARIDGGFAGVVAPQCTGTGCQGLPAAPPIFATPASVTFEGVGNFAVGPVVAKPKTRSKLAKCKRGYVRKRGRCVKRAKAKRAKKAKKSTAKGRK